VTAGDNVATAEAVAAQVGIIGDDLCVDGMFSENTDSAALVSSSFSHDRERLSASSGGLRMHSLSAAEFEKMLPQEKREAASHVRVLARVEPVHKQQLVELLQEDGEVCTGTRILSATPLTRTV
jgi:magnesium-transporting ATPase (P-type)